MEQLRVGDESYEFHKLDAAAARLPYTLRILLENVLRGGSEEAADAVSNWVADAEPSREIAFAPARVLLQDFTGVPCVVDLAAMRDAMRDQGGDPSAINPLIPVELVIDHSVQVDEFATRLAIERNVELEFERNHERYAFLRWGQGAFDNFRVVPPNTGIVHQVNLEYLARVVEVRDGVAFPDTLVGTDSHTTMVNGLGVLGWGVGGIEAEAAMLGESLSMLVPQVVGFRLTGALREGATATDLVLTVTQILRKIGVVGKFVEYFGPGVGSLALADRATLGNMSPETGATCGFFPVDEVTVGYLRLTGRSPERIALVEAYCKENLLWHEPAEHPEYSQVVELDLDDVEPSLAGPRRPQDRVPLANAKEAFIESLGTFGVDLVNGTYDKEMADSFPASDPPTGDGVSDGAEPAPAPTATLEKKQIAVEGEDYALEHGSVVIAAITSCTNTSNPSVMIAAGLLAQKAVERGLERRPWVKSSLAPGSKVVTDYYRASGLDTYLDELGFNTVGYGCTTCIGNSGPLPEPISAAVAEGDLVVCAVLSGNRNFEARIHGEVKANYLASPPLVVAYALAGRMDIDLVNEPLGQGSDGEDVFLRDLWPSRDEIDAGDRQVGQGRDVLLHLRRRLHRRRALARARDARGRAVRLGRRVDVRAPAAVLRRDAARARAGGRRRGRALPRLGRRLRHDRPHLAGGRDQARLAGRAVPDRARRRAARVQLLRRAPRQPRGDGARHLRQRPPQEPPRARQRGNVDGSPARRRGGDDLRGRRALPRRGRADDRDRRQGVRLRLVARLGGEGPEPARRARRDRETRTSGSTARTS